MNTIRSTHIREQIASYDPFNEQEERDKELILGFMDSHEDVFLRSCLAAHMTASAWVTDSKRENILMAYHNIYNSWAWLGGHADGEEDLASVAVREVMEESGIKNVRLLSDDIFSLESLTVDGHIKKGRYVSSHLHLNVTYLIEADETESLRIKKDENSAVAWISLNEVTSRSSEPWFNKHIYNKLNEKLLIWKREGLIN